MTQSELREFLKNNNAFVEQMIHLPTVNASQLERYLNAMQVNRAIDFFPELAKVDVTLYPYTSTTLTFANYLIYNEYDGFIARLFIMFDNIRGQIHYLYVRTIEELAPLIVTTVNEVKTWHMTKTSIK